MTVIDDVISHLNTNWSVAVTPKPGFFNGHKLVKNMELGTNYVNIYNRSNDNEDYDSAGLYEDITYNLLLEVGTVTTFTNMDNMVAEIKTLLKTSFVNGYHYNRVTDTEIRDSSEDWVTNISIELKKLLQLKI